MSPQKKRENILTPYLRRWRIRRVLPFIKKVPDCHLLDIGCGWEARFLREVAPYVARGVGIDPMAPPASSLSFSGDDGRLVIMRERLDRALPFETSAFDVVTMLAVLEHLSQPEAIVAEVMRVLRPGGWFVGTVPSVMGKPVLEFLAFRLHVADPEQVRDHKKYYDRASLQSLLGQAGFANVGHRYFQLGMNNLFYAQKPLQAPGTAHAVTDP